MDFFLWIILKICRLNRVQYSQNSTVAFGLIHVASDETRFTLALKIVFFVFNFLVHIFSLYFFD